MIRVRCPKCSEVFAAGTDHKCTVPNKVASVPNKPVPNTVSVPNSVANKDEKKAKAVAALDGLSRKQRWRLANRERYNASQRTLMAKRRANAAPSATG